MSRQKRKRSMNTEKQEAENRTGEAVETEKVAPEGTPAGEAEAEQTAAEETQPSETESLQKKVEAAEAKAAEYLGLAQRVQADFENFRRRNESVRAEAYADGRREVAGLMLPVLDNLERAAAAAEQGTDEAIRSGVALVLKQMNEIYAKMDVVPIDRAGEKFDPNLENAILQGTADEGEPGTVCQVLQKGYMMGAKVLRHAMVKVVPE